MLRMATEIPPINSAAAVPVELAVPVDPVELVAQAALGVPDVPAELVAQAALAVPGDLVASGGTGRRRS